MLAGFSGMTTTLLPTGAHPNGALFATLKAAHDHRKFGQARFNSAECAD